MKKSEISNQKLLLTINQRFDEVNEKFTKIDQRFDNVDEKFNEQKNELDNVLFTMNKFADETKESLDSLNIHVNKLEATINTQMLTKDYLDDKNLKLKSIDKLTNILQKKQIISPAEAKIISSI